MAGRCIVLSPQQNSTLKVRAATWSFFLLHMKVPVRISTCGHPNTTADVVEVQKIHSSETRPLPVPYKLLNDGTESLEWNCVKLPRPVTVQPLFFFSPPTHTLVKPFFVHLVTLVFIFCSLESRLGFLSLLITVLYTVQCHNLSLTSFPYSIPENFGKGVSALVSPWGETATDSNLPHCFLNYLRRINRSCVFIFHSTAH